MNPPSHAGLHNEESPLTSLTARDTDGPFFGLGRFLFGEKMSIEAMNWALSQKAGSPAAKSVLLILANRADNRGVCWPGLNGIAKQTELSKRAVINNIRKLENLGLIWTETRQQPQTNRYQLNLSGSERGALVNEVHGELDSPAVVNVVHSPSERGAPEPSLTTIKPSYRAAKRVPVEWKPSDACYDFALNSGMNEAECLEQLDQFRDHEYKAAKKDWDACWRTWCRNWKKWRNNETHKRNEFEDIHARVRKKAGLD